MSRCTFQAALWLGLLAQVPTPAEQAAPATDQAIRTVLARQQKNWNNGDLERFLDDYWKSPQLTFSSGGKTRRGFRETRERYLAGYPTPAEMGQLRFEGLEVLPLGDSAALVLGFWRLERAHGEKLGGAFSLVMRQIEGRWLIVHDHTSRDADI